MFHRVMNMVRPKPNSPWHKLIVMYIDIPFADIRIKAWRHCVDIKTSSITSTKDENLPHKKHGFSILIEMAVGWPQQLLSYFICHHRILEHGT